MGILFYSGMIVGLVKIALKICFQPFLIFQISLGILFVNLVIIVIMAGCGSLNGSESLLLLKLKTTSSCLLFLIKFPSHW